MTETSLLLALLQWLVVETALLSSSSAGLLSGNAEQVKATVSFSDRDSFLSLHQSAFWLPGMAVRAMTGMMGDMALSLSSSLGSRRWGNRLVSSATLLSGDDAGMMLSEVSSSSLSILVGGGTIHAETKGSGAATTQN